MTRLHAALVTPLTGPLGRYGKPCATARTLWAKQAANLPADEGAVAAVFVSGKWRWTACVGAGVEEVLACLGERREGWLGPAQWVVQTSLKPDAQWLVTHYRQEEGREPP
jgi:hypothetical protein